MSMNVPAPDPMAAQCLDYLNQSWTAYHAVHNTKAALLEAGYTELSEKDPWELVPGGKYFFTRNMSSLVAFAIGAQATTAAPFVVVGAHTDSPCPKLKPASKLTKSGYLQLSVAPYGGASPNTRTPATSTPACSFPMAADSVCVFVCVVCGGGVGGGSVPGRRRRAVAHMVRPRPQRGRPGGRAARRGLQPRARPDPPPDPADPDAGDPPQSVTAAPLRAARRGRARRGRGPGAADTGVVGVISWLASSRAGRGISPHG
eukprot:SAG11_NODE_1744_length_4334_cov_32.676033_4_plen_259_part_00